MNTLCQCGCGNPAPISSFTSKRRGVVKGQPAKFLVGHHTSKRIPPEQRFWPKVSVGGKDDCWPWLAANDGKGYGVFDAEPITDRAHRFSYYLAHGNLPHGLNVCHKCDNPICVNPNHLFLGTDGDNRADCLRKGRWKRGDVRGEKNGRAKLNPDKVRLIRKLASEGRTWESLAKEFGVGKCTIGFLIHRKTWADVE